MLSNTFNNVRSSKLFIINGTIKSTYFKYFQFSGLILLLYKTLQLKVKRWFWVHLQFVMIHSNQYPLIATVHRSLVDGNLVWIVLQNADLQSFLLWLLLIFSKINLITLMKIILKPLHIVNSPKKLFEQFF